METKITTMSPFFEEPHTALSIREVARRIKTSHTAVRKHLAQLRKEGYLLKKDTKPYAAYAADIHSRAYLNLKLFYNLEKIRLFGAVEKLEQAYDYPTIILFGSFAKALDDEKSDVDLCIITAAKNTVDVLPLERSLRRRVSLHLFDKKSWSEAKKKNPGLVNSICNGIVLSGQLEVL